MGKSLISIQDCPQTNPFRNTWIVFSSNCWDGVNFLAPGSLHRIDVARLQWLLQTHMLHGAGFVYQHLPEENHPMVLEYLPTFARTKSPSFVGKYTSTIWGNEWSANRLRISEMFADLQFWRLQLKELRGCSERNADGKRWGNHGFQQQNWCKRNMFFCCSSWEFMRILFTMISLWKIQCGAPKIAKLVNITPLTMVYGTQITIVFMGFINQRSHHWGAPPCSDLTMI